MAKKEWQSENKMKQIGKLILAYVAHTLSD